MSLRGYLNSAWFWILISFLVIIVINLVYRPPAQPVDPPIYPRLESATDQPFDVCLVDSTSQIDTTPSDSSSSDIHSDDWIQLQPRAEPINQHQAARSKGERICCEVMEQLTGKPFTTVRPDFLRNPETGRNLEIDCYNDELKIGVEYNGEQHYRYPNGFMKSRDEFIAQVRRDQFKVEACDAHGVYLITVPYTVPHDQIRSYLIDKLRPIMRYTGESSGRSQVDGPSFSGRHKQ